MLLVRKARRFWRFIAPDTRELEPGFQDEINKQLVLGLKVVGTAALLVGVLLVFLPVAAGRTAPSLILHREHDEIALALLGAITLALCATRWGRRHARVIALVHGTSAAALAGWGSIYVDHEYEVFWGFPMVLLTFVALIPLRPLAILTMGLLTTAIYSVWERLFAALRLEAEVSVTHVLISIVCMFLAAVVYRLRIQGYVARAELRASLEALERAQAELITSQKAAALGQLAAALTHELNTPIGVLTSTAKTICTASNKLRMLMKQRMGAQGDEFRDLSEALGTLTATTEEASQRAHEVIGKAGRFTNLDRAAYRRLDANDLLRDVAELVKPALPAGVRLELDLQPIPAVNGFPQHLTDTFMTIVRNALEAIPERGVVRVVSQPHAGQVAVRIADTGHGIPPERLESLFEPQLSSKSGRVKANWGLFIARQIVRAHGGEIEIESALGRGTTVHVLLPAEHAGTDRFEFEAGSAR